MEMQMSLTGLDGIDINFECSTLVYLFETFVINYVPEDIDGERLKANTE